VDRGLATAAYFIAASVASTEGLVAFSNFYFTTAQQPLTLFSPAFSNAIIPPTSAK